MKREAPVLLPCPLRLFVLHSRWLPPSAHPSRADLWQLVWNDDDDDCLLYFPAETGAAPVNKLASKGREVGGTRGKSSDQAITVAGRPNAKHTGLTSFVTHDIPESIHIYIY